MKVDAISCYNYYSCIDLIMLAYLQRHSKDAIVNFS